MTRGAEGLSKSLKGDLLGGIKQVAGGLALFGGEAKQVGAAITVAIGAFEGIRDAAVATTQKFNPGLVTIYNDALEDFSAALGEGLYPVVLELIPNIRAMADWLHNNSKEVRALTNNLISMAGFMLKVNSYFLGLGGIEKNFAETKGPEGTSYGLAAQTASYSDIFAAGDQRRLAIATQQMTFAEQTARNTEDTANFLRDLLILQQKGENTPPEVLERIRRHTGQSG